MLPTLEVVDEVVSDIILMRLICFLGGMIRFGLPVLARMWDVDCDVQTRFASLVIRISGPSCHGICYTFEP